MNDLLQASTLIDRFRAGSLRTTIATVERRIVGVNAADAATRLSHVGVGMELLLAALLIKKHSNQINEIVHALGILIALPAMLESGEVVESVSLAAGNTGKGFDLETNRRIAEFTFIQWQGGPEVIRQNKIFKDFYFLAEADTAKRRELYTLGTAFPEKFLNSQRKLDKILAGNAKLGAAFRSRHGEKFVFVRDYYATRKRRVAICDLAHYLPGLPA